MATYTGTQDVQRGFYLNTRKFAVTLVDEPGPLPGTTADTYRRVPALLMLAAAPLLGLVYVIFLPFIGFAVVTYLLGQKAVEFATGVAEQAGRIRQPAWAPMRAFLSGSKPKETRPEETASDAWTEEVEKKLNETDHTA